MVLFLIANARGINGSLIVLEEDGTLVDEDIVVKELDKDTVLMILNKEDTWQPMSTGSNSAPKTACDTDKDVTAVVTGDTNCMRLTFDGGNLRLRKPTKEVVHSQVIIKKTQSEL